MYDLFKRVGVPDLLEGQTGPFRIPQRLEMRNGSKIVLTPTDDSYVSAESSVAVSEVLFPLDRDIRDALDIRY